MMHVEHEAQPNWTDNGWSWEEAGTASFSPRDTTHTSKR
jgi:hypothetical protein